MATARRVAVVVGSLRKESYNRKMAEALIKLAPESLALEIVEIRQLPLYNQDDDAHPPAESVAFKQKIKDADAVLFVTPEYNRSIPGVLKNAIDIASRPYGQSAWNGKPAGIVSVSGSAIGAFGANHILRQSLVFLDMPAMPQPEAYIGFADKLYAPDGSIQVESTREFMKKYMLAYEKWIERNAAA